MKDVKVKKAQLLVTLKKNKEAHRKIFEEALEGYKKEAIRIFEEQLALAKSGKRVKAYIEIEQPIDQTKEYDRAIGMLEMSVEDEIFLSDQDFKCFVMDDWSWKQNFLSSNAKYSGTAATLSAQA